MERNGMCVRVRVYLTAVEANVRLLLRRGLWRSFCLLPCTSVLSSLSPGNSESTGVCGAGLHAQRAWRTHTETQTRAEGEGGVRVEGLWPIFLLRTEEKTDDASLPGANSRRLSATVRVGICS
ncbi:hypothetical protein TcCL_Unassigned04739 [Trypanosoma cruzi]|nr:hypothetical protein TcCL_Unassigned04739 [Trypanosoma cruzi]